MTSHAIFTLLVFVCGSSLAANILVLMPLPFTSHTLTFKPLFMELANRGHNVTYIGALRFPETKNLKQTVVQVDDVDTILNKMVAVLRDADSWGFLSVFWRYSSQLVEKVLDHPALQNLIHDETSSFDVIIAEPYFCQEPLVAFGYKFNAPIVGIFPLGMSVWATYYSGNPYPYSYVPSFRTKCSDRMTLKERIHNTLINLYEFLGTYLYYLPIQEDVMRRKIVYKGSEGMPSLGDMLKNVSIHLLDSHYSSTYSRPYENNVFQVGGLTLARSKSESLDKELSDLMDQSKGVIYFSLGSHVQTSALGKEGIEALMTAFGSLNDYLVLMKWDGDAPPVGLPKNVKTSKWFPQPSVLGHSKTKVFIGHGGLHGVMEAIHHGVPFIGIPQFSDQEFNTRFVISAGFGLRVGKEELTAENLLKAITTLLTDPSYKENAQKRSLVARDRIMDPLDLAVYGVEYVIRHKGAAHLQPAVVNLYWYQYLLIDVFVVILVLPLLVIVAMFKIISTVLRPRDSRGKPKIRPIK